MLQACARQEVTPALCPSLHRIIELNGGQPPLTYKRFQTLISRLDPPELPVEALSDSLMGRCITPVSEDHGDKYGVPSLEELGEEPLKPKSGHQKTKKKKKKQTVIQTQGQ